MKLWLSMIVKDEEENLKKNFSKFFKAFDDVVVIDTWSNDGTCEYLKSLWINTYSEELQHEDKRLIEARNKSIELNWCDWVCILDADEFIDCDDVERIKRINVDDNVWWFFVKRLDHRYEADFEDYKMAVINKEKTKFLFNVHACPQVYLRDSGYIWKRLNWVVLHHYPKPRIYREMYIEQLKNWIFENPSCMRFYRFLWYTYFKNGKFNEAKEYLETVVMTKSKRFPVETMNTYMVLSEIAQGEGEYIKGFDYIQEWLDFYESVSNDFEININFRLYDRFKSARDSLLKDPSTKIKAYEFAF